MSFHLKHPKESFHNTSITLDCEQCSMITSHGKFGINKVSCRLNEYNEEVCTFVTESSCLTDEPIRSSANEGNECSQQRQQHSRLY